MAFKDFTQSRQAIQLLQRSLQRGRLGHAYLFSGDDLDELEGLARTLAKTLNCAQPLREAEGPACDCCDTCRSCRNIDGASHPDIHWARPEAKSRIVTVDQMRELMREVQLKPREAACKVAVIAGADRLNTQAANAFLKTLEEPPPNSVLILLTTEPSRILETILSRCLRLSCSGNAGRPVAPDAAEWLAAFGHLAAGEQKSLLGRYRLLDVLLQKLGDIRKRVDEQLTAASPLEKHADLEADLRDRWEDELAAAIEAEYRRQRGEILRLVQSWLRDVWLHTLAAGESLLTFPGLSGPEKVARRISPRQARENLQTVEHLQRLLHTNVQESLALEVGLLKLHF